MNFVDLILTGCFSSPEMPPLPPVSAPLPEVDESVEERKARMDAMSKKKTGRKSTITNKGGAAGLEGEEDASKKTKLGGN